MTKNRDEEKDEDDEVDYDRPIIQLLVFGTSLHGLDDAGCVWKFSPDDEGWTALPMDRLE